MPQAEPQGTSSQGSASETKAAKLFRSLTAVNLTFQRAIGDWFYKWMLSI